MENIALLQEIFIFKKLPRMDLIQINKIVHTEKVEAGSAIIREGDEADRMYIVKSGSVHVYLDGAADKKEILATLEVGDHFGEMAMIEEGTRSANVDAATDCEILFIRKSDFQKLLDENTSIKIEIYEAFLRTLCARLRSSNDAAVIYRIQADLALD